MNSVEVHPSGKQSKGIYRRMASGTMWSLLGSTGKILALVAGFICARILGKEVFGQFSILRSTINTFLVLGSTGLGLTATKYISEYLGKDNAHVVSIYKLTVKAALVLALVISVLVFIFSDTISEILLHKAELSPILKLCSVILFVTSFNIAQNGILSGFENFRAMAVNTIIGSTVELVLMVIGSKYYGITGAMVGFGLGWFTIMVCNRVSIQKTVNKLGFTLRDSGVWKEDYALLLSFTLPATLASILVLPVIWYCKTLLTGIPGGYGEVAIYEAANQWRIILMFIPTTVSQIMLPILSSLSGKNDKRQYNKALYLNVLLNGAIALIVAIVVYFCKDLFMSFYGKEFDNSTPLSILIFSTIFTSISNTLALSISSRAKMWVNFWFNVVLAVSLIVCTFVLLDRGSEGVAWAVFISYAILMCIQMVYVKFRVLNKQSIEAS